MLGKRGCPHTGDSGQAFATAHHVRQLKETEGLNTRLKNYSEIWEMIFMGPQNTGNKSKIRQIEWLHTEKLYSTKETDTRIRRQCREETKSVKMIYLLEGDCPDM